MGSKRSAEQELERAQKKERKRLKREKKAQAASASAEASAGAGAAASAAAAAEAKAAKKAARKLAKKAAKKEAKRAAKQAAKLAAAKAVEPATPTKVAGSGLPPPIEAFAKAPFAPPLIDALSSAFDAPTPIQAQSWPVALAGSDLIAVAKTGSGKTLAFLLPAFHAHAGASVCSGGPRVLVLAPTRELAVQINAECIKFGKHAGVSSTCVYGGAPIAAQQSALSKLQPTVVVATPGRLCDLLTRSSLSLSSAAYVVLDEADRMLDMGFEPQIKQVFAALPTARQTLFFTATWPKSVRKLAESFLRSGDHLARVFIGTSADAELEANTAVTQTFIQARDDEKDQKMYELLQTLSEEARVVVFANTKRRVDVCARNFAEFGTVAVHGDKQQHERERSLRSFIKGEQPLMFATDVAARGLDIKGVRCNCLLRPIGERSLVLKLGCCCCFCAGR